MLTLCINQLMESYEVSILGNNSKIYNEKSIDKKIILTILRPQFNTPAYVKIKIFLIPNHK